MRALLFPLIWFIFGPQSAPKVKVQTTLRHASTIKEGRGWKPTSRAFSPSLPSRRIHVPRASVNHCEITWFARTRARAPRERESSGFFRDRDGSQHFSNGTDFRAQTEYPGAINLAELSARRFCSGGGGREGSTPTRDKLFNYLIIYISCRAR